MFGPSAAAMSVDDNVKKKYNILHCGFIQKGQSKGKNFNFRQRLVVLFPGYLTYGSGDCKNAADAVQDAFQSLRNRIAPPDADIKGIDICPATTIVTEGPIITIATPALHNRRATELKLNIKNEAERQQWVDILKNQISHNYIPVEWGLFQKKFVAICWDRFCRVQPGQVSPLWNVYFNAINFDQAGNMLKCFREVLAIFGSTDDDLTGDKEVAAFANLMEVLSTSPVLRIFLLIFNFFDLNVHDFIDEIDQVGLKGLQAVKNADHPGKFVALIKNLSERAADPTWAKHAKRLMDIVNYPPKPALTPLEQAWHNSAGDGFSAQELSWYNEACNSSFRNIKISFVQLKLILEPTAYLDYLFVAHFAKFEQQKAREMFVKISMDFLTSEIDVPVNDENVLALGLISNEQGKTIGPLDTQKCKPFLSLLFSPCMIDSTADFSIDVNLVNIFSNSTTMDNGILQSIVFNGLRRNKNTLSSFLRKLFLTENGELKEKSVDQMKKAPEVILEEILNYISSDDDIIKSQINHNLMSVVEIVLIFEDVPELFPHFRSFEPLSIWLLGRGAQRQAHQGNNNNDRRDKLRKLLYPQFTLYLVDACRQFIASEKSDETKKAPDTPKQFIVSQPSAPIFDDDLGDANAGDVMDESVRGGPSYLRKFSTRQFDEQSVFDNAPYFDPNESGSVNDDISDYASTRGHQKETKARFVRSQPYFEHILSGYFKIGIELGPSELIEFVKKIGEEEFFKTFFPPKGKLRQRVVEAYHIKYNLGTFKKKMVDGELITASYHLHPSVMMACALNVSESFNESTFNNLIICSLKIHDYDGLDQKVQRLAKFVRPEPTLQEIISRILNCIANRKEGDFYRRSKSSAGRDVPVITLVDIEDCCRYGIEAIASLSSSNLRIHGTSLIKLFDFILNSCNPRAWVEGFKSSRLIASYIKQNHHDYYHERKIEYEDLNSVNMPLLTMLKMISAPVDDSEVSLNSSAAVEATISRILNTLPARENDTKGSLDQNLFREIFVKWLQYTNSNWKFPLKPKASQVITLQLLSILARVLYDNDKGLKQKTVIANIGFAQGTSLLKVLLGIFFVKRMNKRAFILSVCQEELFRDFEVYKTYVASFGIQPSFNDFNSCFVFCTTKCLETYYISESCLGKSPLSNVVILSSEIEYLFLNSSPNKTIDRKDHTTSTIVKCFIKLQKSREDEEVKMPTDVDVEMWNLALEGKKQAKTIRHNQPNGYTVIKKKYIPLDEDKFPSKEIYSIGHEYVKYQVTKEPPNIKTASYKFSVPHMINQADFNICFTQVSGSIAEKDYLEKNFSAYTFNIPPCFGQEVKCIPQMLQTDDTEVVFVEATVNEQVDRIVDIALRICLEAPVIIVMRTSADASKVYDTFKVKIQQGAAAQSLKESDLQRVTYIDEISGRHTDVTPYLKNISTKTAVDSMNWRITICDEWGSKVLTDYTIFNTAVNTAGGPLHILTYIPATTRMWNNWVESSAKGDQSGRYLVVLNKQDDMLIRNNGVLSKYEEFKSKYSATLIQALLDLQNVKETSELSNKESQNLEGARLNELCDNFYKKYAMKPEVSWPSPQHKQLRDYLLDTVKHNSRGTAAFAEKMGLVEDSDKYLTTSRYAILKGESTQPSKVFQSINNDTIFDSLSQVDPVSTNSSPEKMQEEFAPRIKVHNSNSYSEFDSSNGAPPLKGSSFPPPPLYPLNEQQKQGNKKPGEMSLPSKVPPPLPSGPQAQVPQPTKARAPSSDYSNEILHVQGIFPDISYDRIAFAVQKFHGSINHACNYLMAEDGTTSDQSSAYPPVTPTEEPLTPVVAPLPQGLPPGARKLPPVIPSKIGSDSKVNQPKPEVNQQTIQSQAVEESKAQPIQQPPETQNLVMPPPLAPAPVKQLDVQAPIEEEPVNSPLTNEVLSIPGNDQDNARNGGETQFSVLPKATGQVTDSDVIERGGGGDY